VDPEATLKILEWSKQAGYLKEIPTASKLFDLSAREWSSGESKQGSNREGSGNALPVMKILGNPLSRNAASQRDIKDGSAG
jgi:hypothetical protein